MTSVRINLSSTPEDFRNSTTALILVSFSATASSRLLFRVVTEAVRRTLSGTTFSVALPETVMVGGSAFSSAKVKLVASHRTAATVIAFKLILFKYILFMGLPPELRLNC